MLTQVKTVRAAASSWRSKLKQFAFHPGGCQSSTKWTFEIQKRLNILKEMAMKIDYRLGLMLIASAAFGATVVTGLNAQIKPPVYVIIDISELSDAAAFAKSAAAATPQDVASVGGRYIIRSTNPVALDGSAPPSRFVVLTFSNEQQAKAWRDLPSTRQVTDTRLKVTRSRSFMVEGLPN
jgi:uncharacterized protein (DUF1330 family)